MAPSEQSPKIPLDEQTLDKACPESSHGEDAFEGFVFCNHTGWSIYLLLIKLAGRREPQSHSSGIWGSYTSNVGSNLKTEGLATLQPTATFTRSSPSTAVTAGDKFYTSSYFELAGWGTGWEGLCGGQATGKAPGPLSSDGSACSSLSTISCSFLPR